MPEFDSGFKLYKKHSQSKPIPSGDATLDELLSGGFHRDLIYILYGNRRITSNILLTASVNVQRPVVHGGFGDGFKVVFIDGNNRFNPYNVSKYALYQDLSSQRVLEQILISRVYTLDQLVELLETRISTLKEVKTILISGITSLFESFEKRTIDKLLKIIDEIKLMFWKTKPLIIITTPSHENSLLRSKEIGRLSHFGGVLVMINCDERYDEYVLVQHPYLRENRLLIRKPRIHTNKKPPRNTTIDPWF